MKKWFLILFSLFLLTPVLQADEKGCPADRAGKQGFKAIEEFHHILAPVWHNSWPEKDYDALLAAGPKFAKALGDINKLKPEFKTESRKEKFAKYRDALTQLVKQFNEACQKKDKETAYKIMPDLHDAFEMTASSLLPIHYPEIDGIAISLSLIIESHLPENNIKGIVGSTETLVAKMDGLNEKSIPEDLKENQKEILNDFSIMKKLITQMKECCDKDDMESYKTHVEDLNKRVNEFIVKYI